MWKTERGVSRESVGATDASETGSGQLVSTLTPPPKSGIARAARTDYWDRYVIDVDSRARWAAETIVMVGVLYTAIYMPLQLGFGLPLVRAVDGVVTAIFCCDVMLQFFYAYVDEGFPVNSLRKCARRYASSWFVVDLVAASPFYLMLMVAHWVACLWFAIGWASCDGDGRSWITEYWPAFDADCHSRSLPHEWPHDLSHVYVRCLYFALATMSSLGYGGSPVATTDGEYL